MQRSPMITITRGRFGPTAAQVLEQVRSGGVVPRDRIAAGAGLSSATVGRAVGALVGAGLVRERPDRIRHGAVGRPGTPVEVDPDRLGVLGVHLGRRRLTLALGDLTGRPVAERQHDLDSDPGRRLDVDLVAASLARLQAEQPQRRVVAAGLVGPWRELDVDPAASATALHDVTGLPVRTADHIAAVAAAEFAHRRSGTSGTSGVTLYVYARDTIGYAVAVDKDRSVRHVEVSRVGSLTHFPTGGDAPCGCGRTGCLAVSVGDEARLRELYPDAADGDPDALAALRERAVLLGTAAAHVRDMVAPDRVVLVGQAFTGFPPVLPDVLAALELGGRPTTPVSFTRFGSDIQAIAACTLACAPVYDDPLAVVGQATSEAVGVPAR